MHPSALKQVAELANLDFRGLQARWRTLFGAKPPKASATYLRRRLAYRLQELAFGGLSEDARHRLTEIAAALEHPEAGKRRKDLPVPGTRLVRQWNGARHEVTVTAEGFEYQGRPYRSLSAIARTITGTRWNGPAFFGLRTARKDS